MNCISWVLVEDGIIEETIDSMDIGEEVHGICRSGIVGRDLEQVQHSTHESCITSMNCLKFTKSPFSSKNLAAKILIQK